MSVENIKPIPNAKDLGRLSGILRDLTGRKCWNAAFIYGGELSLHFGRRIPSSHPKLKGEREGEWIFSTCGTAWVLFTPDGLVSSAEKNEKHLAKRLTVLENSAVSGLEVSVPDNVLTILFSNQCLFRVVPTADDDADELPYWELFMLNHMSVSFGPGARWSYRRSDVPASGSTD